MKLVKACPPVTARRPGGNSTWRVQHVLDAPSLQLRALAPGTAAALRQYCSRMESRLAQISSLAQKDKGPAYVAALNDVFASPDPAIIAADVRTIVDTVLQDNVVVGRQVLLELARLLGEKSSLDSEIRKQIVESTLSIVQPRLVSYEEQVSRQPVYRSIRLTFPEVNALRFILADILESEEDWSGAARVLTGISLDAGQR